MKIDRKLNQIKQKAIVKLIQKKITELAMSPMWERYQAKTLNCIDLATAIVTALQTFNLVEEFGILKGATPTYHYQSDNGELVEERDFLNKVPTGFKWYDSRSNTSQKFKKLLLGQESREAAENPGDISESAALGARLLHGLAKRENIQGGLRKSDARVDKKVIPPSLLLSD